MSELLQELNGFSLRITKAIELDDWEQLSEILIQRQARLENLLNAPMTEEQRSSIASVLESVQSMDKLFIDAVQSKKIKLLKEFHAVAQGQKGVRAYYTTASN